MSDWFADIHAKFVLDFIEGQRWMYIVDGLKITILVTLSALVLGLILGALVAVIRTTHDQLRDESKRGLKHILLNGADTLCRLYLTVIRGTPTLVQLLLMFFVFMPPSASKVSVAILTFGINSGAYCTEIFRAGIQGVDKGQTEAGRSLGLSKWQTLFKIVLPQAVKACLPTYTSEFITLIKETSVASFIAVVDLQKTCDNIRNATYNAWIPLLSCALIYLCLTVGLTKLFAVCERRMSKSAA